MSNETFGLSGMRYWLSGLSFAGGVCREYLRQMRVVFGLGSTRAGLDADGRQAGGPKAIRAESRFMRPYALSDALTVEEWRGEYALTVQGEEAPPDKNCNQIIMSKEELDELIKWWVSTSP